MKLEAVDRRHSSHTLCVATVANVIGSRFLVHFDGWDSVYDYWADPTCPYVHPVGWSQEHGQTLTPPCDYDSSSESGGQEGPSGGQEFSWDRYLVKTGASAVPPRAFKPRSPIGFKTGMKLECVDPRNPQLIRVATVAGVKGYRIKIHFDGWSSEYDFWTDDDWPDLHPPGWCQKTGHPLQPPLQTESAAGSAKGDAGGHCPTAGCNGVGHIEGSRYASHISLDDCPYSVRNLRRDSPAFPDRLLGEEKGAEIPGRVCGSPLTAGDVKMESTPSSPVPATPGSSKGLAKATSSTSIDLPIKSESEAELNNRLIRVDLLHPESPSMDQQYDSLEALTPPPKKMRVSFFTGRSAPRMDTAAERRKSAGGGKENGSGTDHHHHLSQSGRSSQMQQHAMEQDDSMVDRRRQSALPDYQANSALVTPLCWSKHAALLSGLVSGATSGQVSKWTSPQVVEFLAKFGLDSRVLDKIKEEVRRDRVIILFCYSFNGFFFAFGRKSTERRCST